GAPPWVVRSSRASVGGAVSTRPRRALQIRQRNGWHLPTLRPVMYHLHTMGTTIEIPEYLLVEAKQLAAERHLSLTRLFEDSLRFYLGEQRPRGAQAEPAPLPLLRDPMPVEGIDLDDTSRLWEIG